MGSFHGIRALLVSVSAWEKRDQLQHDSLNNNYSIEYEDFCTIVGPTKLQELQIYENEDTDDNFQILHTIYKQFKQSESNIVPDWDNSIIQVELASDEKEFTENSIIQAKLASDEKEFIEKEIDNMPIIINEHIELEQMGTVCEPTGNDEPITHKQDNTVSKLSYKSSENLSPTVSDKNTTYSSYQLSDCLMWPKTPERKNKRQVERLPFVITSSGWKKIYGDKQKEKNDKKKRKQERGRKKEENKMAKKLKISSAVGENNNNRK